MASIRTNFKLIIMTAAVIIILLTCCAPPKTLNAKGTPIDINIDGSSIMKNMTEALAKIYMMKKPELKITTGGLGSDYAIEYCSGGRIDIGTVSRELTEGENRVLRTYLLGRDGIAVIAHPAQKVTRLTTQEVADIFSGNITNWKEVGGDDADIHVMATEVGDSSQSASARMDTPQSLLLNGQILTERAIECYSDNFTKYEVVRTKVSNDPNAIGFIPFGALRNYIIPMVIDDKPATDTNIVNDSYPYIISLYLTTRGQAKDLAKDFIEFCLSGEGQTLVRSEGYGRIE